MRYIKAIKYCSGRICCDCVENYEIHGESRKSVIERPLLSSVYLRFILGKLKSIQSFCSDSTSPNDPLVDTELYTVHCTCKFTVQLNCTFKKNQSLSLESSAWWNHNTAGWNYVSN